MSHGLNYRPDVDGLRAVAVLSVVLSHAHLGLPGGFVGVDVFFVISGYLIAGLIRKDLREDAFSLVEFWMRRIRRIMPALAVVTVATLVAGWFWLLPRDYYLLAVSVKALLKLIANIHFMEVTGYFEPASQEQVLLHTWSLAVEEQFYLLAPVALLLLARLGRERLTVVLLFLTLAVSFAASVVGTYHYPVSTFYLMPTRAWELLAGVLLAYCSRLPSGKPSRVLELAAVAGLAAILVPVFLYDSAIRFPGLAALPPVAGATLLIWVGGGAGGRPMVSRILASRPMVFVGLVSYSFYLWHWPIIVFYKYLTIHPLTVWERLALVAAGFGAAVISWRFVETPFRTLKIFRSRTLVVTGAVVTFCLLFRAGRIVERRLGYPDRIPAEARLHVAPVIPDRSWIHQMEAEDVPAKLIRHGDGPPKLLVWGDSYAMASMSVIESLSRSTGVPVVAATRSQTAPVLHFLPALKGAGSENAAPFNAAVWTHLRSAKIPAVLLIGVWTAYVDTPEGIAALLRMIDDLHAHGVRVWFMKEVPTYPFDIPRAMARHRMMGPDLSALAFPADRRQNYERFYASLVPQLTARGAMVLDPIPFLRSKDHPELILPYDSDGSFYRDSGHLNKHGAKMLEPMFAPMFESLRKPSP